MGLDNFEEKNQDVNEEDKLDKDNEGLDDLETDEDDFDNSELDEDSIEAEGSQEEQKERGSLMDKLKSIFSKNEESSDNTESTVEPETEDKGKSFRESLKVDVDKLPKLDKDESGKTSDGTTEDNKGSEPGNFVRSGDGGLEPGDD